MNNSVAVPTRIFDRLEARVFPDKNALGRAAAGCAVRIINHSIEQRGVARIIIATGPSQDEVVAALVSDRSLDWNRVIAFHMDEYVGIAPAHPASFRHWLKTRVADVVHPGAVNYLNGDAADADAEAGRYGALLRESTIDLCMVGFGENGHIAFNDPPAADFTDPLTVKRVELDRACRNQQVGEGHFSTLDAVPREALTITCSTIMQCANLVCCVPDARKATAVQAALEGPIATACPASVVRRHPHAWLFLDHSSARLLDAGSGVLE